MPKVPFKQCCALHGGHLKRRRFPDEAFTCCGEVGRCFTPLEYFFYQRSRYAKDHRLINISCYTVKNVTPDKHSFYADDLDSPLFQIPLL